MSRKSVQNTDYIHESPLDKDSGRTFVGNPCVYCLGFARTCQTIEKPYRIIYYIKPDQIDILAVIHSARDLPDT